MRERLTGYALLAGLLLFNAWLIAEMVGLALRDEVVARRRR